MWKRYLFMAALLCGGMASAQQADYAGRVAVKPVVTKVGNEVNIHLDISLDSLYMKSQHALVLTPVLQSADKRTERTLEPVIVNGRIRRKADLRNLALGGDAEYGTAERIHRRNGEAQTVSYRKAVPYEKWMRGATLLLRETVSGCAACALGGDERTLAVVLPPAVVKEPLYVASFSVPRAEEVKRRDEQCELCLTYRVGKSDVLPSLGSNRAEINKLQQLADRVKMNKDLTLTGFRVTGYASPEGSCRSNLNLSGRRAASLADYFSRMNGWQRDLFQTEAKGEDWDGLAKAVETSSLDTRERVLAIIREEHAPDARDAKLRDIDGGVTYATLLKDYYPSLRRSFCVVDFTVRPYTPEEAKKLIKDNPKLLSLKEMYEVAVGYPEGSAEHREACLTAQHFYPQDADAATNAAAVLIEQGRYDEAYRVLEGVEQTGSVCNALGILHAKGKDYDKAAEYFARAARQGCKEAVDNERALKNFIEELNENNY